MLRLSDTHLSPVIPQGVESGGALGPQARPLLAGMMLKLLTHLGTLKGVGGSSYLS